MSTLTTEQQNQITQTLSAMPVLCVGLGDEESACSIAAINLALTGKLTDQVPDCMSLTVGNWILRIQDKMPAKIRNSRRWRALLPLAAGTGREREQERFALIMEWIWGTLLPLLTPVAEKGGFASAWAKMLAERTPESAAATTYAARVASSAYAARVASYAANAASYSAAAAATYATDVTYADVTYATYASAAASAALDALGISDQYWTTIDPCAMLERLLLTPESTP